MNENKAVDYFDVITDDKGHVKEFRAHCSMETPKEEIDRINGLPALWDKQREIDAAPKPEVAPLVVF
jgi:hypothetical protein